MASSPSHREESHGRDRRAWLLTALQLAAVAALATLVYYLYSPAGVATAAAWGGGWGGDAARDGGDPAVRGGALGVASTAAAGAEARLSAGGGAS